MFCQNRFGFVINDHLVAIGVLILFWVPLIIIFIVAGIELVREKSSIRIIWLLPLLILLIKPFMSSLNRIMNPSHFPEVRETLDHLSKEIKKKWYGKCKDIPKPINGIISSRMV